MKALTDETNFLIVKWIAPIGYAVFGIAFLFLIRRDSLIAAIPAVFFLIGSFFGFISSRTLRKIGIEERGFVIFDGPDKLVIPFRDISSYSIRFGPVGGGTLKISSKNGFALKTIIPFEKRLEVETFLAGFARVER